MQTAATIWHSNWLERFNERSAMDAVRVNASKFASFCNEKEHLLLAEYDDETGVGWSGVLRHRMLMQRVELANNSRLLQMGATKTCERSYITSVRDRQLVAFVNVLATSLDLRPQAPKRAQHSQQSSACTDMDLDLNGPGESTQERDNAAQSQNSPRPVTELGAAWQPQTLCINHYRALYNSFAASSMRLGVDADADHRSDRHGAQRLPRSAEFCDRATQTTAGELACALQPAQQFSFDQRRRKESHVRREWQNAAKRVQSNQERLLQHYRATKTALSGESAQTRALLCAQIRLIVRALVQHPQNLLNKALVEVPGNLRQLLCNDRINESEIDNDDAQQIYNFFTSHVRQALHPSVALCATPPLSANYSYAVDQIEKFYCNTRWLARDMEFIDEQMRRVAGNQQTLQNTLETMLSGTKEATRDNTTASQESKSSGGSTGSDSDSEQDMFECVACTESVSHRDVCLFACGHWCCWSCFENGGDVKHQVEGEEDPYIPAAQPGRRCFHCRYIEQEGEEPVRVRQSWLALTESVATARSSEPSVVEKDSLPETRTERGSGACASSNDECDVTKQTTEQRSQEDDVETHDSKEKPSSAKSTQQPEQTCKEKSSDGDKVRFVFTKTEAIVAAVKRAVEGHDKAQKSGRACKIAIFSQYVTQLHEVYDQLRSWTRTSGDTDIYLNPTPSCVVQEQSRLCDWTRVADSAAALLDEVVMFEEPAYTRKRKRDKLSDMHKEGDVHDASGAANQESVVQGDSEEDFCQPSTLCRKEGRMHASEEQSQGRQSTPPVCAASLKRHMVVLQHIDITRDTRATRDAAMFRCAPPLFGMTHAFFAETFCMRLTDDSESLPRTANLYKKLLQECRSWSACRKADVSNFGRCETPMLKILHFQTSRAGSQSVDQMLHNALHE